MNYKMRRIAEAAILTVLVLGITGAAHGSGSHTGGHGEKAAVSHWSSPKEAAMKANPVAADKKSIDAGQQLYSQLCADCHGANGDGNGPDGSSLSPKPTNLRAMAGGHADGDFAWKISNGRGDMPAWGEDLERTEIWHLVNYIQALPSH